MMGAGTERFDAAIAEPEFVDRLDAALAAAQTDEGAHPTEPTSEPAEPVPSPQEPQEPAQAPVEPQEPTEPTEPPPAQEPTAQEMIEVLGRQLPRADIEGLLVFGDWATADPARMQALEKFLQAEGVLPAPSGPSGPLQPPAPVGPTEEDLEDLPPVVRDRLGRIDALEARIAEMDQAEYRRRYAIAKTEVDRAKKTFAEQKALSEQDLGAIVGELEAKGWLPLFIRDAGDNVFAGTLEALDVVYQKNPRYRGRDAALDEARIKAAERQRNAGKVGGSSGSSPRTERDNKVPETMQEKIDLLAKDFAEAMGRE